MTTNYFDQASENAERLQAMAIEHELRDSRRAPGNEELARAFVMFLVFKRDKKQKRYLSPHVAIKAWCQTRAACLHKTTPVNPALATMLRSAFLLHCEATRISS